MTDWNLKKHPTFGGVEGPVTLVVMDGVGLGRRDEGDAVWLAKTPHLDRLAIEVPTTRLAAHGLAVGLPTNKDMGNSEVGHNALGAGRVFEQGAMQVAKALESGSLYRGAAWRALVEGVKQSGEPMHFMGLLSDGGVHSHIEHLLAMIRRCHEEGVAKVRVHVLLDGRDVSEKSALVYIDALEGCLAELNAVGRDYRIASGGGRMKVTMDRYEADWGMVELGWRTHVRGEGRAFQSASGAIETLRQEDASVTDQHLPAFVIVDSEGRALGQIRDGASVVFFNYRGDRALEITRAFEDDGFSAFERGPRPAVRYAGMMQYDGDLCIPTNYLVEPPDIDETLGEYMVRNGVSILACSETQKYGHVTYFWNGNRGGKIDESRETYVEIPSDRTPFDEQPWMKAKEITDRVIKELESGAHRHARVNYANGDMVGHTGNLAASITAVEAVDHSVGRLMALTAAQRGALIVTADHGNADEMFEWDKKSGGFAVSPDGARRPKTSHTLNAVPLFVYAPSNPELHLSEEASRAGLANVAATTLHLCGLSAPPDYHPSLLVSD